MAAVGVRRPKQLNFSLRKDHCPLSFEQEDDAANENTEAKNEGSSSKAALQPKTGPANHPGDADLAARAVSSRRLA
jgi:hypothetical protein